jgi:DNA-binding transcriptional regulator LsrR (DeoR family)
MINQKSSKDRQGLLADIAEMYFLEGRTQSEIAAVVGVTRSNISRMLTEARNNGIVLIQINRPLMENHQLSQQLIDRFGLINARVVTLSQSTNPLSPLGKAAGIELISYLRQGWIIGTSWGTAISATVEEIDKLTSIHEIIVVQLLGAQGARIEQYDAHSIVRRLADKLDAEGVYLNAPFLVEDQTTASSLLSNKSISDTLNIGKNANIALLGVGSSDPEHSSYYLADYVNQQDMVAIHRAGAIGDICGRFYDLSGNMTAFEFQNRLIGISAEDLIHIPIRIGVAGGPAKVEPIIGALRNKLINILVSDEKTVIDVLERSK